MTRRNVVLFIVFALAGLAFSHMTGTDTDEYRQEHANDVCHYAMCS